MYIDGNSCEWRTESDEVGNCVYNRQVASSL
jgi:hypothetical protein